MANLEIAIRKNVENNNVQYWLMIKAKNIEHAVEAINVKEKFSPNKEVSLSTKFINSTHWNIFLIITVMINTLITVNYFLIKITDLYLVLVVIAHLTCLIYWTDFIATLIQTFIGRKKKTRIKTRGFINLTIDGISLLPLSIVYFILERDIYTAEFWASRLVTLLRFYRIPLFLSQITTAGRNYWTIFIVGYIIYLTFSMDAFSNIFYVFYDGKMNIYHWNATAENRFLSFVYLSTNTFLNVGFGDIPIEKYWEKVLVIAATFTGNIILGGVITGTLAIKYTHQHKRREIFRQEYKGTKLNLRKMNVEKKVLEKMSENIVTTWKYKTRHIGAPLIQLLPIAQQKEILFDININYLNRSLIFSKQPRAFLRSIVLQLQNVSYLPGDIVVESFRMAEAMICVASGVIEILSEDNDETPLLSFTNGTILSEAALFISLPNRCVIRAATYVELQILKKANFARVALRYPDIYRSMQAQIYSRLNFKEEPETEVKTLDSDFFDSSRRKVIKRFIQDVKRQRKEETKGDFLADSDSLITKLYVWSENIPRMKILPTNLVQRKPWILRPNSFFLDIWEAFILVVINLVVYLYPYLAVFKRKISNITYTFLIFTDVFYLCDLIVQCVTAVEKKDNFTYTVSIKKIVQYRLTTVGFYLDILSTYNFNIYSDFIWPEQSEFAYLLLSLNRLLKWWRMIEFFKKQENNLNRNLLLIVTIKYIYYCSVLTWWISALLYFEACPDERCRETRWFARLDLRESRNGNPNPVTNSPDLVSYYWAIIVIYGVGYGEIAPKALVDCTCVILASIVGVFLLCFTVANASAAFRHLARHRTIYQEELLAVERFMEEHDLPKVFKLKVKNYFQLQWNYDQGFILKRANVVEGLLGQQKTIVLNQLMKKFLAVPIFQEVGDDFLRMLTKSSKICVLPPQEMITEAGSFAREMYILESGYCEISTNTTTDGVQIIGPVNSFGFIEMILGTPMEINVQTITHVRIIFIDYYTYLRAINKFPMVKKHIDDLLKSQYGPLNRRQWDNLGFEPLEDDILSKKFLLEQSEMFSSKILNVYKYHKNLGVDYWTPFQAWGKFRIFQFFFLPFVILPYSSIVKIWMPLRLLNAFVLAIIAPIHYSLPRNTDALRIPITVMLVLTYIDMYLLFHVGYYDEKGLLMFHPVKTSVSYLKGNFALDLITAFPFHLILSPSISAQNPYFYAALKLIIVLQFYKIWQVCYYLERDITRKTDHIKIIKFVPLTFVVANLVTGFLLIVECSDYTHKLVRITNESTLNNQFLRGLALYCPRSTDIIDFPEDDLSPFKMYIIVYYWVAYTMTQTGFGDVTDHTFNVLIVVIIITVLGVFLFSYMFANLTSVKLSVYNVITNQRKMVLEMINFMKLEHVSEKKKEQMYVHYEYAWIRTEGATPQSMFTYVPTALRENILAKMYEATLRQVPAFAEIDKLLIQLIGRHLNEIYFLRGETVVNYHDVQEYIYLIYRGKVDVTSNEGKFITSLASGGLFGNISNKLFCLSSVVVTAAKNVDVLRFESSIFFKALQVFPEAKSLLDYLVSQTKDFIEPLPNLEKTDQNLDLESPLLDTIPFEFTSITRVNPELNFSSMDLTKGKKYFHFNYSIYKIPGKSFFSFVILPTSELYKLIDICTLIFACSSFAIILYIFAFQDFSIGILVVSYLLDLFFYIKLALQFHFSFLNKHGDLIVNTKLIRQRYLQSKKNVAIDIISNLPLEVFSVTAKKNWILPVLSMLRLNRILRICYFIDFYRRKFKILMVNKVYLHLSYLAIIMSLLLHFLSCLWYFSVCPLGFVQPNTWLTRMKLENADKWELYINSMYFISSVFTTTGYGDIPIFSTWELILVILIMIFCRFSFVWITSGMASIAAAQGLSLFTYHEKIMDLKLNLMNQNLSDYQLSKMWHYVSHLWLHSAGKTVPEFITIAPYAMKCEIMNEMFGSHLSQAYPFSQMEKAFLRQLAAYLKRSVYIPGNYIVQQGDIDRTMYFIHRGQVLVLTIGSDMMETIHFKLFENDHFGMIQGLILGEPHAFSYRAKTEVEILSLNLNHWDHLLRYFPDVKQKIYKRIDSLPYPNQAISHITLENQ